jgi:uncharacterized protein with PQ loop repeat
MKKKVTLVGTILCGVAAVIWTIRAVLDIVYVTYHTSPVIPVLSVLCAVIWIVAFFVNLNRYRSSKEQ